MTFQSPWAFYLFIPLALIVLAQLVCKREGAVQFSSVLPIKNAGKSLRQRLLWTVPVLETVAASALILGLARPQKGVRAVEHMTRGVAIEMVMDISSSMSISMRSANSGSTRLEVAKRVFEDFIVGDGNELGGRPDDLIGLITFARYSNTVCPLTLDHNILVYFARHLEIEERPNEDGTAYGDAVALASARLRRVEDNMESGQKGTSPAYSIRSKVAILLTDGDNNCGRHLPLEAAAMARKWGVRVYTISFGERRRSETGGAEEGDGEADASLDASEQKLKEMAEMTGGIFRRAHDAASLRSVYEEVDSLEKTRFVEKEYLDYEDRYLEFVLSGLLLLAMAILLKCTWLRKV